MKIPDIGFIVLSVFCAGGLFAYVREALRLGDLVANGTVKRATILSKNKVEGSETVVHYLVTYKFTDEHGKTEVHEQDLNSMRYFDNLKEGDEVEVLYREGGAGDSYPLSQVSSDLKVSFWICIVIILVWIVMGVVLY